MGCCVSAPVEDKTPRTCSGDGESSHGRGRVGNRYPKIFYDFEQQYNPGPGIELREYPLNFRPHHYKPGGQTWKGQGRNPDGSITDKGYARVITDQHGRIHGVSYHTKDHPSAYKRASERNIFGRVKHFSTSQGKRTA